MTIKKRIKTGITAIVLLLIACGASCNAESVDTLTYAVFPYLPDAAYYQELIEKRWAEIEPDIRLIRADWDCYEDGAPEGIDVIMYDAVKRDAVIEAGWMILYIPAAASSEAAYYIDSLFCSSSG